MIKRKLNLLNLINMLIIYKYQCIQKCIEYVFSKLWLTYFLVRSRLRREICEYSPAVFQWNDWCWMSWKSAGDRNANKSPKIPYSTMVGKMDVIRNYYPWSHHHQKLTSSSDWYMALATFPVIMFTDSNFSWLTNSTDHITYALAEVKITSEYLHNLWPRSMDYQMAQIR